MLFVLGSVLSVVVVAHLQETHHAGTGVFGAEAVQAVGQQQSQTAVLVPLGFGTADEVVEDHLGTVEEVSELGFPEDEVVGVGETVAILEA